MKTALAFSDMTIEQRHSATVRAATRLAMYVGDEDVLALADQLEQRAVCDAELVATLRWLVTG